MRLIRFLFRLVVKGVLLVLILLLLGVVGLWARGRFFSGDKVAVDWVCHSAGAAAACEHDTEASLGSALFVGDTESAAEAAPATQPSTQPSALPCGMEVRSHDWQAMPGYNVVAGPGQSPSFSMLGFEYGKSEADGKTFRWLFTPYWLLMTVVGVVTALWLGVFMTVGRHAAVYCPSCQHDLRQPIRRCPECGATLRKPMHVA